MALAPQASPSCGCPAATGSTACPVLRPCRPGHPLPASPLRQHRSTAPAAPHAPSGWMQRRGGMRRLGSPAAFAPSAFSGAPSFATSTSAATQGQRNVQFAGRPQPPPGCSLAAVAPTTTIAVHGRRWGYAPSAPRFRAVGGSAAAADMGLSGAGPPPPPSDGQPEASSSSSAADSSDPLPFQRQRSDSNGHPPAAAAAAAAAADVDPGATGVDGLDDTRKFVFADEWGFTRVGGDLPDGTTPATFADMFPQRLFAFDAVRAAAAITLPLAAMAAGYAWLWYWHGICPAWQQAAVAALIGTAYAGLFKVAHECARFAFLPQSPRLQDALGWLLMLPSLYPYTSWRLHYFHHMAHLNELWEDTFGWHPYTKLQLATEILADQRWRVTLRRLALATPLKLLASIGHWLRSFDGLDLKRFHQETRGSVLLGWAGPIGFLGFAVPAILAAGGVAGLVSWYFLPWLVFHFWMSTLSLVAHTAPHIPWRPEGEGYDAGRAAVCGTVTLRLPRPVELLLNDANYLLPQHLAPGLPMWHAREAYEHARERLLPYMTEARLSVKLLTNHITKWQVYDEEKHTYEPLEEVLQSVDADIEIAMREAERWEAANPEAAAAALESLEAGEEGGVPAQQQARNGAGPAFA